MELRRYWQIICKRRSTLLKIIGLIVGTVMLGSFIISPVYTFSSNIWVKTSDPKVSFVGMPTDITSLGIISSDLVMYSQLAAIKNLPMIQDVIARMKLEKKKGRLFGAAEFLDPSAVDLLIYKKGVRVKLVTSTQLIQVSGFSGSPKEAAEIANKVAEAFVGLYNQNIQATARQALRFIQENIPKAVARLKEAEDALAAYRVANHLSDISSLRNKWLATLTNLQDERENNENELREINQRISLVQAKLKKIPTFQKVSSEYRSNATLAYLREKLMDAEASLAGRAVEATPEYLGQQRIQASIEKLKNEYKKQAGKLFYSETTSRNKYHSTLVQSLIENEINRAVRTSRRQLLQQRILSKQKELDDLTLKELALQPMQRKVAAAQTTVTNLLSQEQLAKLACNLELSNASVIERAVVPELASQIKRFRWFPRRKLLLVLSFLLSLLVGLTTIFLQEYFDDSLTDPQEAQAWLQTPVLASLPELPPLEPLTMDAVMAHPPWTQAVWTLSYLLKPSVWETPLGLVAISSAAPSEGKTLVTASLGQVLASRGLRVMMVDLHFSHPSLASLWEAPTGPGVQEVLLERAALAQCVRRVGQGELYLLPRGRDEEPPGMPPDLPALAKLLASLKSGSDTVLLDLPAVSEGEGAPLTALGDQVLMVVRAGRTSREVVARALDQIKRCQEGVGGLILNGVQKIESWRLLAQPFMDRLEPARQWLAAKLRQWQAEHRWPKK